MNLGNRCQFASNCEIFQGKTIVSKTPLPVFRNVFCNRGMKGWKNCERFNELTGAIPKKKTDEAKS
jgi:hypothetical protein